MNPHGSVDCGLADPRFREHWEEEDAFVRKEEPCIPGKVSARRLQRPASAVSILMLMPLA
jgi:hypothetical protein